MARYFIYAFKKAVVAIEGEFTESFVRGEWQDDVELEFRARLWFETDDLEKASRKLWLSYVLRCESMLSSAQQLWDEVGFYHLKCCSFNGLSDLGNPFIWQGVSDAFLIGNEYYDWDSLDFVNGKPYIYDEKGEPVNG